MLKKKYPVIHTTRQGGFIVRLASMIKEPFATATKIEEMADGSIEIYNDRIWRRCFAKGEYLSFWPVNENRDLERRPRPPANKPTYRSGKRIASKNI